MPKGAEENKSTKKTVKKASRSRSQKVLTTKVVRKAPTKRSVSKSGINTRRNQFLAGVILVMAIVFGVSAYIGMTDQGEIDVKATIQARADALAAGGKLEESEIVRTINIPKRTSSGVPSDGLVGQGNKETEQQKREQAARAKVVESEATSTATSTADTATSSTEDFTEESADTNSAAESETAGEAASSSDRIE